MRKLQTSLSETGKIIKAIASDSKLQESVHNVVNEVVRCFNTGKKVMLCGNGGSAADAQHLAAELSGRFYIDRHPLPAEALHVNSSYITAVANDYSFDKIYSRYVAGAGKEGDILIGLTTSGNSENIVQAFNAARENKIITIGFTGKNAGRITQLSDFLIQVPSTIIPKIQEMHLLIGHVICEVVEKEMFGHEG
ncbi:D-sedoheptulose-7-phosphate isomerase [Maribellus maritimus]|uniref:D-sedoheptulose-7-phosphate isomerase n=1 Tax=Maribellus maritimus TaxID=2870838 RepID=UPI001EEC86F7|nr:SIS domain-containing protein [Maribellus maritimus]MCG6185850.1 SIS domain-containing protein [Maribellus maritimus]